MVFKLLQTLRSLDKEIIPKKSMMAFKFKVKNWHKMKLENIKLVFLMPVFLQLPYVSSLIQIKF